MQDVRDDIADPEPQPPVKPGAAECCESGCERCVFDVYADALERYREAHAAWRARHGLSDAGVDDRGEAATRPLPPSSS